MATKGLRLPLYGLARLEHNGEPVATRVKALAALYYLALHGPAYREDLAALLWGGGASRQNLRVNLHTLRRTLESLGYVVFPDAMDPVSLPEIIETDAASRRGPPLEGLDGLSPDFQTWLEAARTELRRRAPQVPLLETLVERLAGELGVPSVLVLQTPPAGHSAHLAQELARRMDLPFVEGLTGNERAVRFLQDYANVDRRELLAAIEHNNSLLVLERPLYGEDPRLLLEVRSRYPADRVRYVELPSVTWPEARVGLLDAFGFEGAAAIYLESCGEPRYLQELLSMTEPGGRSPGSPVPHRVRAAYELYMRNLSPDAQLALKRLSVHPGDLPDTLVRHVAPGKALYELEQHNWLVYRDAWAVNSSTAQQVVYQSLPPGQRHEFHREAVQVLDATRFALAAAYHRLQLGEAIDAEDLLGRVAGWRRAALAAALQRALPVRPLPTVAVDTVPLGLPSLEGVRGPGVQVDGATVRWWRTAGVRDTGRCVWALPPGPLVLRLRGNALAHNPLGIGLQGDAAPLRIRVIGTRLTLVLCDVAQAAQVGEDIVLPLTADFDFAVVLPAATGIELESRAHTAVAEVALTLAEIRQHPGAHDPARTVEAIDLRFAGPYGRGEGSPPS
ncbi:MAG TPA: hypothetical protein VKB31_09580 [Trueperaceae bacterium]|nr:hypothetical protein [Trueperaceae bacterium]